MPRKETAESTLRRLVRTLKAQLADPTTPKFRVASLSRELRAAVKDLARLEREEAAKVEDSPKRPVGRPRTAQRPISAWRQRQMKREEARGPLGPSKATPPPAMSQRPNPVRKTDDRPPIQAANSPSPIRDDPPKPKPAPSSPDPRLSRVEEILEGKGRPTNLDEVGDLILHVPGLDAATDFRLRNLASQLHIKLINLHQAWGTKPGPILPHHDERLRNTCSQEDLFQIDRAAASADRAIREGRDWTDEGRIIYRFASWLDGLGRQTSESKVADSYWRELKTLEESEKRKVKEPQIVFVDPPWLGTRRPKEK